MLLATSSELNILTSIKREDNHYRRRIPEHPGKTTTATATKPFSGAIPSSSVENTTSPRSQGTHCANCNKIGSAMKICSRC